MQLFQLLAAALSGGTVLLFGMLGGIFTETRRPDRKSVV